MQKTKIINLILLACLFQAPALAQDRIMDGRQYALNLGLRLEIDPKDIMIEFNRIKNNLPREKRFSELETGMPAMGKFAAAACSYYNDVAPEQWSDINGLYVQILDRAPTQQEIDNAVRDNDQQFVLFANCMVLALSPEMILIPNDEDVSNE